MTTVKFNAKDMTITAVDHAGSSAVCAGVSALLGALAKSLDDSEYMLEDKPQIEFDEATAKISCCPKPEWKSFIVRSYWTVLEGLELISTKYPEACSLSIVEC